MLNIEYYKHILIQKGILSPHKLALVKGQLQNCESDTMCKGCFFNNNNISCSAVALDWLFSEYEEPEVDWSKVNVDTPILIRDYESSEWAKRYFAKFVDGKVYAWKNGATSWSADGEWDVTSWNYAKLAESEE
jgi:hypothetical protein|nr:MAG TPA: hypothetical protein [Caudoviricetes sp.]